MQGRTHLQWIRPRLAVPRIEAGIMRKNKSNPPAPPEPNSVFDFPYPFVRDTFQEMDADGTAEIPTWKPGVRCEYDRHENDRTFADGMGAQIVAVVGTFKPGRFPLRVFYTRKWRDPDGKEFGKGACRIASIAAFRSIIGGFRHKFEMTMPPFDSPAGA